MGSHFARHHTWRGLLGVGLLIAASVLFGLSYVWKPRLAFPATYAFFAFALWLFSNTVNKYLGNKAWAEANGFVQTIFGSGLLVLLAGFLLYRLHSVAARGDDALLGYLGWPHLKSK